MTDFFSATNCPANDAVLMENLLDAKKPKQTVKSKRFTFQPHDCTVTYVVYPQEGAKDHCSSY